MIHIRYKNNFKFLSFIDPMEIFSDLFKKYDNDNSGFIDFNEFQEFCKGMALYMDTDKMLLLFSNADKDGDSQLDLSEFQRAIIYVKL